MKITLNEKQLLVKRLKELNEGGKSVLKAQRLASKLLLDELSELRTEGKITTRQLEFVIKRFSKVNLLNENSIEKFVDYMANVFENVAYAEAMAEVSKKRKRALKNASTVKGPSKGLSLKLKEVFTINPNIIPKEVFKGYATLIEMFREKARVLTLPEQSEVNNLVDKVLGKIREEESTVLSLKEVFDNFDSFKSLHPAYGGLTKKNMLEGLSAPLHPGALKYYKEVGLK